MFGYGQSKDLSRPNERIVVGIAKTIADLFRYRRTVGINLAVEGLREALQQRKATPAKIAKCVHDTSVWKIVEPYLTAYTSGG